MKFTFASLSVLILVLLWSAPTTAAIYKCEKNGKIEYRDTPCYYQNNNQGKVDVEPTKKSGSNFNLVGKWCQYATAPERNAPRSVINPREWLFDQNDLVTVSWVLDKKKKPLSGTYSIASDFLQVNNGEIGNWFIEDYSSNTFTLVSATGGVRYLKGGRCVAKG